jgi:hypothetical protein
MDVVQSAWDTYRDFMLEYRWYWAGAFVVFIGCLLAQLRRSRRDMQFRD